MTVNNFLIIIGVAFLIIIIYYYNDPTYVLSYIPEYRKLRDSINDCNAKSSSLVNVVLKQEDVNLQNKELINEIKDATGVKMNIVV